MRGNFSKITPEQAALIRKLYEENMPRKEIAAEVGLSLAIVKRFITKNGLAKKKRKETDNSCYWTEELKEQWRALNRRYGTQEAKSEYKNFKPEWNSNE